MGRPGIVTPSSSCSSCESVRRRGSWTPAQGRELLRPSEHDVTAELPAERHPGVSGEAPQAGARRRRRFRRTKFLCASSCVHRRVCIVEDGDGFVLGCGIMRAATLTSPLRQPGNGRAALPDWQTCSFDRASAARTREVCAGGRPLDPVLNSRRTWLIVRARERKGRASETAPVAAPFDGRLPFQRFPAPIGTCRTGCQELPCGLLDAWPRTTLTGKAKSKRRGHAGRQI